MASRFFDRALELEPNNAEVMDEYADMLLGVGNVGKATKLLRQSIMVAPEGGHSKYMNMGQLMEGADAVQCFERGVTLMQRALGAVHEAKVAYIQTVRVVFMANRSQARKALEREMSNALLSIAEVWMSDLCFDGAAESNCEAAVNRAIATDGANPDAYQVGVLGISSVFALDRLNLRYCRRWHRCAYRSSVARTR